jgi:hypothetical protein
MDLLEKFEKKTLVEIMQMVGKCLTEGL